MISVTASKCVLKRVFNGNTLNKCIKASLPCYFSTVSSTDKYPFVAICKSPMSKNILFNHIDSTWKQDTIHPKPSLYTLEEFKENRPTWTTPKDEPSFNLDNFFRHLHTNELGRNLLYSHELSSTQTILQDSFRGFQNGLVCIADKQTAGRGRNTNKWSSPYGCLMFSFKTQITNQRDLPMVQYLATLVMCNSLEAIYNTGDMNIGIKWPNDIYYNKTQKVGGIICQSSYTGRVFDITIGIGINISNKQPTTCMDEIASNLKKEQVVLGRSTVLASFCNQFESAMREFQMNGFEPFMKDYLDTWIHSNEILTVISDDETTRTKARVTGISSETGMLLAEAENGQILELFPDTHSLNLMDKLLYKKK